MKSVLILALASVCLFSSSSFARCFPESTRINPMSSDVTGISEAEFNAQIDLVEKVYGPEIQAMGYHLVFNRLWSDDTINSDTTVDGKDWVINSYGGLARYKGMTPAGYLAVACHELGHHMGGAPIYAGQEWPGGGASVEGEADYWATLICVKRLNPSQAYAASQVLADVLADLEGTGSPQESTPDRHVVKTTYEEHPKAQCRLDTYLAGLNCPINSGMMSNVDPKKNSCYHYPSSKTYDKGSRPRCWFAPAKGEDGEDDSGF